METLLIFTTNFIFNQFPFPSKTKTRLGIITPFDFIKLGHMYIYIYIYIAKRVEIQGNANDKVASTFLNT